MLFHGRMIWHCFLISYQFSSSRGAYPSLINAIIPPVSHEQIIRQFRKRAGSGHLTVLNISTYLASKSQQFIVEHTAWVSFSEKWWLHYWYSCISYITSIIRWTGHQKINKIVAEIRPRFWEICRISIPFS